MEKTDLDFVKNIESRLNETVGMYRSIPVLSKFNIKLRITENKRKATIPQSAPGSHILKITFKAYGRRFNLSSEFFMSMPNRDSGVFNDFNDLDGHITSVLNPFLIWSSVPFDKLPLYINKTTQPAKEIIKHRLAYGE